MLFELFVSLKVYFLLYKVFLCRELLDSGIKCILSFLDTFLVHVLLIGKTIQVFFKSSVSD